MSHSRQRASSHYGSNRTNTSYVASQAPEGTADRSQAPVNRTRPREDEVEQPVQTQEAEEIVEEDPLIAATKKKLRTTRSKVWDEFERIVQKKKGVDGKELEETEILGKCDHCSKLIQAKSANGTSCLKAHLKTCKERPQNKVGQRKLALAKTGNQVTKLTPWKYDPDATRLLVVKMIAKHDYPINMVEHAYFREFVRSLNPSAKIYSRNTTRDDIVNLYGDMKIDMEAELHNLGSRCSLTTDMWTSKHTRDGYCCITCHYIDDDWKLHKKTLAYILVPSLHTGEVLAEFIKKICLDWNIDTKLFAITADNAAANGVMMRNVSRWLENKGCLGDGSMFHMRCNNHILHLVVLEGIKVAAKFITQIRDCVKYVKSSQPRKERFENALSQVRLATGKSVTLDVDTRWNSTFKMLK